MHCTKQILSDLLWTGADDRRLTCFEGVYGVPNGVSYNSYLLLDEKTVLFDTVDKAVAHTFFDNVAYGLGGRKLDYLVIHHMEPDHAATIEDLIYRYPDTTIVCNAKIKQMLAQYFDYDMSEKIMLVKEGDVLNTGRHELTFVNAPMVHWPEVMMSYDKTDKILFTADAFGTFGALNGRIFADEVDFMHDWLDEARRYYTNIVGKYGPQVQMVLKKAAALEINYVCPLHGFVWRKHFGDFLEKYNQWSTYTPEVKGVCLAYASVYGHTENMANILAGMLSDRGVPVEMFDTSVIPASYIVASAFRNSHLVFAATTYNAGIFVTMENLLNDIVAHSLKNRKVALLENGTWGPMSGKLMKELLSKLPGTEFIQEPVTIKSSVKEGTLAQLEALWGGSGEVPDEPAVTLMSIFATYGGGDVPVGTAVTDLTGIVVTAHYSDGTSKAVTDYALSGTIAEGSNTITVSYGGKSTTFVVTGVSEDEPESTEPVYQLAQETVFDGTSGIDTGYTLLDKDKSWSVCVDFTGNGKTVWDASPNASKGMALTNRGGYFRTLYAALQQVDISGGNETNHKVIVTHTKGTNSVQYHYIYEGASRVDGEAVNEKYLETDNIINVKPTTVKLGTNFNDNEKYNGTIHRFEIYERVLTADEINAFMGVSA